MIANPFIFFALVILSVWTIKLVEAKSASRFFELIPSIVVIYFVMMIVGNIKIFDKEMIASLSDFKTYMLSMMIILMLLKSDIAGIYNMKFRLLASFFAATISIMCAFVLMWFLFKNYFDPSAYKAFGALSGSWIGGTANMIAVASVVGADNNLLGFCLVTDAINYALWVMILLFAAGYKERFNSWTDALQSELPVKLDTARVSLWVDVWVLATALLLPFVIIYVSSLLPHSGFMAGSFWTVIISTVVGIGLSFTMLERNNISSKFGFWLLYLIIAMVACGASFDDFSKAPLYIAAGSFVILTHAILMIIYAKLTKTDLFSISVSSLANIGGVASAPVLAASYSNTLIGAGVIMAMLGYIIGTFGGLFVTYLLGMM